MEDIDRAGIIPRSVYSVFDVLESTCAPGDYEVTVSHLEIYQEELNDLLAPHNDAESLTARLSKRKFTTSLALAAALRKKGIQVTYDPKQNQAMAVDALRHGRMFGPLGEVLRSRIIKARLDEVEKDKHTKLKIALDEDRGVVVRNLTERRVKTPEEIFEVLEHSTAKRVTAETMCNGQSSRSHSIFTLNVKVKERDMHNRLTGSTRIGRLNLVDLSGSENRKRAGGPGVGVRASESKAINQGLLALGRVIKARTENSEHIPFRDSKLTRILEESLGGNCITTLILTISPNHKEVGETLSTLNYAHKAKIIECKPTKFIKEDSAEEEEQDDSEYSSDDEEGGKRRGSRRKKGASATFGVTDGGVDVMKRGIVMPWSGRVPMRTSVSHQPRQVPATDQQRMLHAPSVEWVRTNLLSATPDKPFLEADQGSSDRHFGFISARSGREAVQSTITLSNNAQHALRSIFRLYDREQLKTLQNYLNSPAGIVLSTAVQSFSASSKDGVDVSNATTGRSRKSTKSSASSKLNKFGTIDEGVFLKVFAAAGKLDPIRAASVVTKLGFRPNFSIESPNSKRERESTNERVASPPGKRRSNNKRPQRRPASASSGRRKATGKQSKNKRGKRPSTAGSSRRRELVSSHSSFLKGAITPRHHRGPLDFYWKYMSMMAGQNTNQKKIKNINTHK